MCQAVKTIIALFLSSGFDRRLPGTGISERRRRPGSAPAATVGRATATQQRLRPPFQRTTAALRPTWPPPRCHSVVCDVIVGSGLRQLKPLGRNDAITNCV
ncbi:hypothetical protein IscW_ISCW021210 [Ixodes scapularis]|uniref:Uncharacterized protein n=1 Tax=Ixodes scapularis TaxID=6945 RepID=B7Q940_IXOSC|nr:hypothetical protein IscW_ISCW021210 [Ixodes scapularis]|eukprot:XP_002405585.1 hypothetical protein IscW_ISCW021210 [Ixodes scapularis]